MSDHPSCAGVTKAGRPCRRILVDSTGFCAWHREGRRQIPRTPKPLGPKPCRACGRTLARRLFPPTGTKSPLTGERYGGPVCYGCLEKARRAAGIPVRHKRVNGSGLVRCSACRRWQDPSEYGYPPSLKGRPTAYCHGCQRELDRMRWRGERRAKGNADRVVRQRRERRGQKQERRSLVKGAILTIRRRGLTKAEICKLADIPFTTLLDLERGDRMPTPAMAERFVVVLGETAYLPLGKEPAFRRRLPHPDLDALIARCRPRVLAFPVRSRWKEAA